jgi:hypothetical protein
MEDPDETTSSTIKDLPLMSQPTKLPLSPCNLASFLLNA